MNMVIDVSGQHVTPHRKAVALFRDCVRVALELTDLGEPAPPLGTERLRSALAFVLGDAPELIAVTDGVRATVPLLAPHMRVVAFEVPSFEDLPALAQSLRCNVLRSPWPELQSDDSMPIWMTHPARNPDGASLSTEAIERLGQRKHIAVINEIYRWSSDSQAVSPKHNVVAVGSLSKIWGPAARLGWLRGNVVTQLGKANLRTSSPSPLIQNAWADFLIQDGLRHLRGQAAAANASRQRFADILKTAGVYVGGDGPSSLMRLPPSLLADQALDLLMSRGVRAVSGRHFGVAYEALRFTFTNVSAYDAEVAAYAYLSLFS